MVYKFNESKTLEWLTKKVHKKNLYNSIKQFIIIQI